MLHPTTSTFNRLKTSARHGSVLLEAQNLKTFPTHFDDDRGTPMGGCSNRCGVCGLDDDGDSAPLLPAAESAGFLAFSAPASTVKAATSSLKRSAADSPGACSTKLLLESTSKPLQASRFGVEAVITAGRGAAGWGDCCCC